MAGVGALITIAVAVLKLFGVEVPEDAVAKGTEAAITLGGICLLIWGQVRRKDLKYGLIRKL